MVWARGMFVNMQQKPATVLRVLAGLFFEDIFYVLISELGLERAHGYVWEATLHVFAIEMLETITIDFVFQPDCNALGFMLMTVLDLKESWNQMSQEGFERFYLAVMNDKMMHVEWTLELISNSCS